MSLNIIKQPVSEALEAVEKKLNNVIEEIDEGHAQKWVSYFMREKGHRLRPLLALLAFKAVSLKDDIPEEAINLSLCMELLHTASLVHDDVIDEETDRRGQKALNRVAGNKIAVLVGNVFYLKAFELSSRTGMDSLFQDMIQTAMQMCYGEIIQGEHLEDDLSETDYLEIIRCKTAQLMGLCMKAGAQMAGADGESRAMWERLGLIMGYEYQLRDDGKDVDVRLEKQVDVTGIMKGFHLDFENLIGIMTGQKEAVASIVMLESMMQQ